ncbi:unnamed protein product [Penicillium salamii]|uniref:Uncharacterized protein n=1 Tax=Penicillium salamii TaxID=1612424 RepID=A0A9W4IZH1_9EURO|nr:unnamed protein product [Penicillium salamii]CAG7968559.1 unnamed protein product [Penicillium salamii]CAG8004824.1 unnamed protein product [Penicillium salamii]CAG8050290.1 unnamed protein product [Penicillium salamii]CAG8222217.1 unnamed protein product [Penicillium salamii]
MEIEITNFPDYLPFILNDISSSCCISIDFELSGLAFPPSTRAETPTVQERYLEAKEAAERYQILQVGLTICHENPTTATYTLKPYNFNISPITNPGMDVHRNWVFGSRSMEFLLNQGFSIDTMCNTGVRYLSREEEELAIQIAVEKSRCRTSIPDLKIQEDDRECLEFLQSSRLTINSWLAEGAKRQEWLNIPPPTPVPSPPRQIPLGLSSTQKRLVHQLVSIEYPGLTSRGASTFVQIQNRNPDAERRSFETKLKTRKQRIRNNIGFRWIAEALVGGNLNELDPEVFEPLLRRIKNPMLDVQQLSERVKRQLKQNRPVMVGHNMFFDLLFFYRCFIGSLPDTLQEFNGAIHDLFPMLADTKYLATHDCGIMARHSSLEDLNNNLAHLKYPKIELDVRFTKYKSRRCAHEAGYDSLLTALAFIKLGGNLQRNPALFDHTGEMPALYSAEDSQSLFSIAMQQLDHQISSAKSESHEFFDQECEIIPTVDEEQVAEPGRSWEDYGDRQITNLANRGMLVPRLGTVFWSNYGNKLRVFGTREGIIRVTDHQIKVGVLIEL